MNMQMSSEIMHRRILVTGGSGFLGRQVCERLRAVNLQALIAPHRSEYDLTQQADVRRLLQDTQPEMVLHLAAVVGGIGANQASPGRFFYDNLIMGVMLLEEARLAGVKKFVNVGTICSYPNHAPVPFREEQLWNGYPEPTNAAYGIAKKALIVQAQAYRQQYGFHAISLLPVNLYGPGDHFDAETSHVIPGLIRKVIEARDTNRSCVTVWGTGKATREFLHVRDAAAGIVAAMQTYDEPEPMNLGTGIEISIRELVAMICELCGYRGEIVYDSTRPDGQPRRCVDISRAREKIGWNPQIGFRDGLRETIAYYEEHVRQQRV